MSNLSGRRKDSAANRFLELSSSIPIRSFSRYGTSLLAAITGMLIGLYVGSSIGNPPIANQPELQSMSLCLADILNLQGQKNEPAFAVLRDAREHCYSLINAQGLLNDYAIRKLNFYQQFRANGVLMWMVVAVTFSGVLLAALQLMVSSQLATAKGTQLSTEAGELTVQHDRLVLKSSVTGLFILLISFCFFLVFVFYVYKFETPVEQNSTPPPSTSMLPTGELGPAPTEKK